MDVDSMTIGDFKALQAIFSGGQSDGGSEYELGEKYLIRTVTYATVGRVVRRTSTGLVLDGASWVADTGRFGAALAGGPSQLSEVEFRGDGVRVSLGAIVDADTWRHELPSETK